MNPAPPGGMTSVNLQATTTPCPELCVSPPPFQTVAALITDDEGRVLLVRKRGSRYFIQPGGKREPGEDALQTLARELGEELGVTPVPGSAVRLGAFEDIAVNEPGRRVHAEVFVVAVTGTPTPQAEIAALTWVDPAGPHAVPVAPLSATKILPAYAAQMAKRPRR